MQAAISNVIPTRAGIQKTLSSSRASARERGDLIIIIYMRWPHCLFETPNRDGTYLDPRLRGDDGAFGMDY